MIEDAVRKNDFLALTNHLGVENRKCHMAIKRCTKQPAQTAEKNVMFLSNQTVAGQFTAENATLNADHQEDTKRKLKRLLVWPNCISFFIYLKNL